MGSVGNLADHLASLASYCKKSGRSDLAVEIKEIVDRELAKAERRLKPCDPEWMSIEKSFVAKTPDSKTW